MWLFLFVYFVLGCVTSAIISILTNKLDDDFTLTMGFLWPIFWLIIVGYIVYILVRRIVLWVMTKLGFSQEEIEEIEEV
jgi:hypothetical protein